MTKAEARELVRNAEERRRQLAVASIARVGAMIRVLDRLIAKGPPTRASLDVAAIYRVRNHHAEDDRQHKPATPRPRRARSLDDLAREIYGTSPTSSSSLIPTSTRGGTR